MEIPEIQITHGAYGHMLNGRQVFSHDDHWIVYDLRNDETHIGQTCCIEKVNVMTGEVVRLYSAPAQTAYGPGVGAAAWNPRREEVIFIHGLLNCDASRPYDFTRRFGALWRPTGMVSAEARKTSPPFIPGALRGGTHAHSWSADGTWLSFTYNDDVLARADTSGETGQVDLRTVGVMAPVKKVSVPVEDAENFGGAFFSVLVAEVTASPAPGSDEIEKAFDECWVGQKGYRKDDETWQERAIAFQGHVRTAQDEVVTEVFVCDIPDDITRAETRPLEGTETTRPGVPAGLVQRRVTFTGDRPYPGMQGPRHWLRSSPDGSRIYFLMKDDDGLVQVFDVSVNGGPVRQITFLPASAQGQFNLDPAGRRIALIADNSVWIVDIASGAGTRLTPKHPAGTAPVGAVLWNHAGDKLVYNRYVPDGDENYLQIFRLDLP